MSQIHILRIGRPKLLDLVALEDCFIGEIAIAPERIELGLGEGHGSLQNLENGIIPDAREPHIVHSKAVAEHRRRDGKFPLISDHARAPR